MAAPEPTDDTLFAGELLCSQPRDGYRFSLDAVLLAHFCAPKPRDLVLDLGAGCGVISLILAYRWPGLTLTCLELQAPLAATIRLNIEKNSFAARMRLVEGDLRRIQSLIPAGGFDLVVANPPYFQAGSGRINPNPGQAAARHELYACRDDFLKAASFALRPQGRLTMIYPARRAAALFSALNQQRLTPKRLRLVHPHPGAQATHLLLEATKNGADDLAIAPPLYVRSSPGGGYSPEITSFYQPGTR